MSTSVFRVHTVWTGLPGSPYLSTHYFDAETGTEQDAANAIGAFWDDLAGLLSTDAVWRTDPEVATIATASGEATAFTTTNPLDGTGSSGTEILPTANQVLIRWNTGVVLSGRRVTGHTFIPGITQDANDDGVLISSGVTGVQDSADNLIAVTDALFQVYSRARGVGESVVSATVSKQFAVLRSRRD